jgi:hypothetical protein
MDPNEALAAIRDAIKFLASPSDDSDAAWSWRVMPSRARRMIEQLTENVAALDDWLKKGGFLPDDWSDAVPTDEMTEGP